ncbi:glycosyltransferase family A protein [Flavobacterium sp.]|uniref:glycosyltransferase family A protein n=1 Tax=Flavobacterium sp. TaxID=239 RepID=UPI00286CC288|nr:glycosyltransferase family A protein [Flavobacterium sp.]
MRIGFHPHKDQIQEETAYTHQIIIPVFIPNHDGYFKDSFAIFKLCLHSLFETIHPKTFVTIINNGSDATVVSFLDSLYDNHKIHELIHTQNIGKLNAILKGLSGNNIELVTIADSDVLFLPDWQIETNKVFVHFPKAGIVGIVPQYKSYMTQCHNVLWDNFWKKSMQFIPIKNPKAIEMFYESIGWDPTNPDYLKLALGLVTPDNFKVYIGSGHFVATYKKNIFNRIITFNGYKMGGNSERYLDSVHLKKNYWRLTTHDNYAYHMGNVYEPWMGEVRFEAQQDYDFESNFPVSKKINSVQYFLRNHLFRKLFRDDRVKRIFFRLKKLPKEMIPNY